jgi:RNA polymerase sigma-70 factor (ECF subfamily)
MQPSPIFQDEPEVSEQPTECDEILMEKISQQQHEALDQLHARYARLLRGVISNVVQEESEADDVLQEAFLQVWREARTYSPKVGKPLGWVITIAKRRAIDRVRRRSTYRRAKERFEDELKPAAPLSRDATITEITGTDLRQFLKRRMQILPILQREALELAYFGGLSQRQIASKTGSSLGTVKTRLALGLQKLSQCVRPMRNMV